ncbi:glycoside hydrolase family 17 protein [Durotheca rogersii]|uniref:glycoside hydrolase family 17 protein n=1 Tax=Durotheca rogersii TaxID=419775 RepID=UPI002220BCFA|nr:glycoside hydrolase family 17 protein [Durotheca rogersii]KAI5867589.1 glycoside hydrolase family 17 protein [Durotheca rogersii]
MRFSTLLTAAVATGSAAAASGRMGFALGNKRSDASCKEASDYVADFAAIAKETTARIVRIYAASDCDVAKLILPIAKQAGFQVVLGIWPDTDESFKSDKAAVVEYAPKFKDQVYAITVGSEAMYRGNFTGEQLAAKIRDVKSAVGSGFKVGTADSWNKYADGTADAIVGAADILLCNAFSYWQGQTLANATGSFYDDIFQVFGRIQERAGGTDRVELWVGETGWPTDGDIYQRAQPGVTEADTFYHRAVCGMVDWGFNVFYFEAFDEEWKPHAVGEDGSIADETSWGAMTTDRKPKYSLKC